MSIDLAAQVEQERAELAAAPLVESMPPISRCHFCGQLASAGSPVVGPAHSEQSPQERFRGVCCGG